jgi:hypothetical protein
LEEFRKRQGILPISSRRKTRAYEGSDAVLCVFIISDVGIALAFGIFGIVAPVSKI